MKVFLFIKILAISSFVWAAGDDVEIVPRPKETIMESSSEFNRMDKKWFFDVQLLGVGPSYVTQSGIDVGYFIDRNMLVFGEFMLGKLDDGTFSTYADGTTGSLSIKGNSLGVHFKHFVSNSFYYRAGLDYRSIKYSLRNTLSGASGDFDGRSFAITFNIGNQWQWENFNLGCDWIGISLPISNSLSHESSVTNIYYPSSTYKDHQDILVKNANFNVLRFYLGASF